MLAALSIWIAVKWTCDTNYSSVYSVKSYRKMLKQKYSVKQLIQVERQMCQSLNWTIEHVSQDVHPGEHKLQDE